MNHIFLTVLLTIVILLPLPTTAQSQERVLLGTDADQSLAEQNDPLHQERLQALRDQAVSVGKVRVIVGLRTPFAAEGLMDSSTVARQRNEISAMQSHILSLLPDSVQSAGGLTRFETIPFIALPVTPEELDILQNTPDVISIHEDKASEPLLEYSVPLIGGETAWAEGFSGSGQAIAILDTGVDKSHPFLLGRVVSEACYSTGNADLSKESLCPGGATESTAPGSGVNCGIVGCDHGTHVAGIAAGNGAFSSGVAKDADIIAIQVFHKDTIGCRGSSPCILTYDSDYIKGLERVFRLSGARSIAAVNLSLGGGGFESQANCDQFNPSVKAAIDNLRSVGIATIASSGNDASPYQLGSPACISSAISVGSTWARAGESFRSGLCNDEFSSLDQISCFSNSASFLNLLAPGSMIESSVPGGTFDSLSGTSMAAPHVAGAWAVLKQLKSADVETLLNALTRTGTYVMDIRNGVAIPRINIDQALDFLSETPAPNLYSAVLPYARSAQVGQAVTAFTTAINDSPIAGEECAPSLPVGTPASFSYQTTDVDNRLIGEPNTPVAIPAGSTQNFLIALTPDRSFPRIELPIVLKCENAAAAPVFTGVNTFSLSSSVGPTPDLIAISVTPSNDGVVRLPSNSGTGFFTTAAINIGTSGKISVEARLILDGEEDYFLLPELCETTAEGDKRVCDDWGQLTRTVSANETLYYSIFLTGQGWSIPFDPAHNRVRLTFQSESGDVLHGATSVAIVVP